MSLKAFHVFFILISGILTTWFGLWCFNMYEPGTAWFTVGIASLVGTGCLALYLGWVLKKLANVGMMILPLALLLAENQALACSVCFGDQNSSMVQGVNVGMGVLLVVVGGMLAAFGSLFLYWRQRSKALDRRLEQLR